MKESSVAVANLRYEPVAARLTCSGGLDFDIGIGFDQRIDAIEIGPTGRDIVAQMKSMVELRADIQRSVFDEEWPLRHNSSAQSTPDQHLNCDAARDRHTSQLVRKAALNDRLFHLNLQHWLVAMLPTPNLPS